MIAEGKTVRATEAFRDLFAARIDLLMAESILSQADWARLIGCTPGFVSSLRAGKRIPSLERASIIAAAMEVSLDWLTGLSDER